MHISWTVIYKTTGADGKPTVLFMPSLLPISFTLIFLILYNQDYHTQGRAQPQPESKNDYTLLSASEVAGYTELMFERLTDTSDDQDIKFVVSVCIYPKSSSSLISQPDPTV